MKNKTLNHFIIAFSACIISLGLVTVSILWIPKEQILLQLTLTLLSAIADAYVLITFYNAIKGFFSRNSEIGLWVAGIVVFLLMPVWIGFKLYVFEGDFNLAVVINTNYLNFFDNFMVLILEKLTSYFSTTLFNAPDVLNQLVIFSLEFMDNAIIYFFIPILPLILIIRDLFSGNEEYKFTKEEQEDFDELKF